ncbi:DUF1259 domain-containing protein [Bacillus sp. 165]|uniref:DUF1259 domain-containing protein n=1 Tax=Bacillus sp. 165 TaxID=1529117 RepID=UPI001AD9EF78|nr:DUF1259 domain-containing protein [Bacillus sp. 165]MBO9128372.1 DUF1259 domain-containing protein [Bacillus sp. 165]
MKAKVLALLAAGVLLFPTMEYAETSIDCNGVGKIFNAKAELEKGICKIEIVRKNKQLIHQSRAIEPKMIEFVYHMSFEKQGEATKVLGELALLETEVNPVIDELRKGKIEISAIHNHWMGEHPRIMYLHLQGIGKEMKLAKTIKNAIDKTDYK